MGKAEERSMLRELAGGPLETLDTTVVRVAVLGPGLMGAGIAAEYLAAGHQVTVTTASLSQRSAAIERIGARLGASTEKLGWAASAEEAAAAADLVVDCLPEDRDLKRRMLRAAQAGNHDAILATNTSSFGVADLAAGLADPTRFLATHYLSPPELFSLVEVVPHRTTSTACVAVVEAVLRGLGKEPVRLRGDLPGFVINRLQFALLREACNLVAQGVADRRSVDRLVSEGLARRWAGTGPFECVALGGSDLFAELASRLFPQLSDAQDANDVLQTLHPAPAKHAQLAARRRSVALAAAAAFDGAAGGADHRGAGIARSLRVVGEDEE